MNFYQTCGISCVMESAYVPFLIVTAVFLFFMAKDVAKPVLLSLLLVIGLIPWALGALGNHMTLEKIEMAQKMASPSSPPIAVILDTKLLWYIPAGTTVLTLLFMVAVWIKSSKQNSATR